VLVGHTSLNDVLDRVELAQLNQRVARRCRLEPLDGPEVGAYIRHRLATAQRLALAADIDSLQAGDATVEAVPCHLSFTSAAVRAIARHSQGIPRVVNLLCDRALEIGYERHTHTIRALTVRAAAGRVIPARPARRLMSARPLTRLIARVPTKRSRAWSRAAAIAAMVTAGVAGVGAGAWSAVGDETGPGLPPPPAAFAAAAAWIPRPEMGRIEVFDRMQIFSGALNAEPKGEVPAGDPRLLGVALLRQGRVVSFALDMTAEPRRAMLHPVSDRVFELEVGPVIGPVRTEELTPASEVPLVSQLSIREQRTTSETFVRARVMLRTPGRADVRVAGRVVYVDIQPLDVPR
jgi:hypothetical protein